MSCRIVLAWPDAKRTQFSRQTGAEMCEKDSHRRCLPASMVLPVPIKLDWFRCVVPRRLFLLGTLDDDYLQSAIECLNVFRCVLTQDSFHTHSLSQRKGVGGHINTWGRHGTSICEARCAARTVMLRSHPIIPMPSRISQNKTHLQLHMKLHAT